MTGLKYLKICESVQPGLYSGSYENGLENRLGGLLLAYAKKVSKTIIVIIVIINDICLGLNSECG